MARKLITGLIAAPFTPMLDDGEINYSLIEKYVDVLLEQNIKSAFVNGTTGEGPSLTLEERKKTAEKWIEHGKGKLENIIIHVGTCCLKDSKELAKHAAAFGATAISCLPPYYFRPNSVKVLVDCLAEVAKEAPNLPFLYYHIPGTTGVEMNMYQLLNEASERIPSFSGMKFTSFDLVDLGRCADKFQDTLSLCYGKDEQLALGLMLGAGGGVGSTYNYAGRIASKIFEATKKGDTKTAVSLQVFVQKYISMLFDEGFDNGVNKAVMAAVTGLPIGPPRLPIQSPSKEKLEKIIANLKAMGFFEERK